MSNEICNSFLIPKGAVDKRLIIQQSRPLNFEMAGKSVIYYLIQEDEIIYIGQTLNLTKRLLAHMAEKTFDRYSFLEVSKDDLDLLEAELILNFKPALNKGVPSQSKFWSYDKIKRTYGFPKRKAQKIIGTDCIEFNGNLYVVMTTEKHDVLQKKMEGL